MAKISNANLESTETDVNDEDMLENLDLAELDAECERITLLTKAEIFVMWRAQVIPLAHDKLALNAALVELAIDGTS